MQHRIVLIGSGNLATALGIKLMSAGHQILQVYSRNLVNAKQLAQTLNSEAVNVVDNINADASLYLICIKDDAIGTLTTQLITILSNDKLIAHTSGVNSPDLIDVKFINRGLFYPLQSFSKLKEAEWTDVPVFIEGNSTVEISLKELANTISNRVLLMNDSIRTHLHLASVFANNFSNYNLIIAKQIMDKAEIPFEVLKSLMKETVEKAFVINPRQAQTGPAKRGDLQSIEKHIRLLVQEFPEYRSLYKKYSQIILQEFKHENPDPDSTS